jgi:hypothetical protein
LSVTKSKSIGAGSLRANLSCLPCEALSFRAKWGAKSKEQSNLNNHLSFIINHCRCLLPITAPKPSNNSVDGSFVLRFFFRCSRVIRFGTAAQALFSAIIPSSGCGQRRQRAGVGWPNVPSESYVFD